MSKQNQPKPQPPKPSAPVRVPLRETPRPNQSPLPSERGDGNKGAGRPPLKK